MRSSTSESFRKQFAALPPGGRKLARKQFRLWLADHAHPSLHFKRVGPYWSVRVDRDHRALGIEDDGVIVWFFIGRHDGYERRIQGVAGLGGNVAAEGLEAHGDRVLKSG